ncbi:NUDIX domain-containing protein [Mycoplasmoides pirum]|uniref:NUDIX domain-containing protein n=1 Tax=Mycoplasmoides pirum TaxID=2122 RepID=UPI00069604E7|nr:NUDIX domain-containing protein [Mycoplasmoides pirum]
MNNKLSLEIAAGGIITIIDDKTNSINILLALTKNHNPYWGFPKGHTELNENLVETAIREIKEETNLDVTLVNSKLNWLNEYSPFPGTIKKVTYFWFKPKDISQLKKQESEISKLIWVDYKEVFKYLTYPRDREIFIEFLNDSKLTKNIKLFKQKLNNK